MKTSALKAALIAATARSIGMDIAALEVRSAKVPAGSGAAAGLNLRIAELKEELAKAVILSPADYSVPEKHKVSFKLRKGLGYGSSLGAEVGKAAGSDCIVAGIQGDDFSLLEAGRQYSLEAYVLRACASDPEGKAGDYVFLMAPSSPGPGFSAPDQGAPAARQ